VLVLIMKFDIDNLYIVMFAVRTDHEPVVVTSWLYLLSNCDVLSWTLRYWIIIELLFLYVWLFLILCFVFS